MDGGELTHPWQKEVVTRIQESFSISHSKCRFMASRGPNSMLIPSGRLCPEPSEWEDQRLLSRTEEDKRRLLRWVEETDNDQHRPRRHISLQETRRQPTHQEPLRRGKKKVKTSVTWTRKMRRLPLALLLQSQKAVTWQFMSR